MCDESRNRRSSAWRMGRNGIVQPHIGRRDRNRTDRTDAGTTRKAVVDAIDIDADACLQAQENAESSLFAGRINVFHSDLADFAQASTHLYGLIVSNPPYFVDSLKCPNLQRNTARHTDTLTLEDLLQYSRKLLAPQGRIALILPYDQKIVLRIVFKHKIYFFRRKSPSSPYPMHNRNDCWPN